MKRTIFVILTFAAFALVFSACAAPAAAPTTAPAAATTAPGATTQPTSASAPAGATKVTFWHSMGGDLGGKAIPQMLDDFNKSQTKCFATATYQGTYDDGLNKLKAGLQSGDVPTVMQLYDIGTRLMVDLKVATPVQDFIDKEKYDVSDLEPNILAYYTVDNKLQSMPFNTSNPMLYYNKDAFKAAGLDPNKPPRTFDEVEQDAKKLTVKDSSGKVTQYGVSFAIYGWFFEQFLAVSGGYYVNNGNGHDARATAATFNSPEGLAVVNWWKKMYDEGVEGNYGRNTTDTRNAFVAGKTAMIVESTATLRSLLDATKGKFELGTGFYPRPNEDAYTKYGTIIGGASLWILNARPAAEQECGWQLVKFLASPKEQAFWHTQSGYYPISKSGYNEQVDKDWRAKYPQFQTAIDQLHMAPNTRVTQGGLIGVFPSARQTVEVAIESVLQGKATPKDALDKANADVTQAIVLYNQTVK
jgi:sn-glycerol 3-phosphate transport system substrate-binding protein